MPLFRFRTKYSSFLRRRPDTSRNYSGGVRSPEKLEMRKMLTGSNSLPQESIPVDFEIGATNLALEIGSHSEPFASVDAYADWLIEQAVQQWQHVFDKPAFPDIWLPEIGDITIAHEMGAPAVPSEASFNEVASSATNTQIQGVDEADFVASCIVSR